MRKRFLLFLCLGCFLPMNAMAEPLPSLELRVNELTQMVQELKGVVEQQQQQIDRMRRIGVLLVGGPEPIGPYREALADLGYFEGRNIQIEVRSPQGQDTRLPELAEELVRSRVDVIIAVQTPAAHAASQIASTQALAQKNGGLPASTALAVTTENPSLDPREPGCHVRIASASQSGRCASVQKTWICPACKRPPTAALSAKEVPASHHAAGACSPRSTARRRVPIRISATCRATLSGSAQSSGRRKITLGG